MAIIPDNTTDTGIHKLVERNEYPRTSEMDRMAAELFGRDLDLAKHTAAAADQINAASTCRDGLAARTLFYTKLRTGFMTACSVRVKAHTAACS